VEIHSELNESPQPGYRGVKTTLIDREPSVTSARVARDRESTRRQPDRVFAEIRYQDDSGPQTYFVKQNEVSIGRGGEDLWVDLPLYTNDEVSREHLKLRRDPSSGGFTIVDQSRNGTWLNGRRLSRGVEEPVPGSAEIKVAEVLKLSFEVRK
jgi:pSer/pThr/pTyr-binding forkhead associated (FHA) protein